jgi:arylamine N-acetyltransferase
MRVLTDFMEHFGIKPGEPARQLLGSVAMAFASLPYENITKIIKWAEAGSAERARRYPEEVIRNHIHWGSGGTCFSLTSALACLVRGLGWRADYILADRRYGQDTHCALLVWIDDVPHILDPGYLIITPVPVPEKGELEVPTAFNRLILVPEVDQNRISLSTARMGRKIYRLTYKMSPADEGEFLRAWDESFNWDMMRYPLLTRTAASKQIYLNGSRFQISDPHSVENREIPTEELVAKIAFEFRMDPSLVARAISILKAGGETGGKAASR